MKIVLIGPANPYRGGIAKFNDTLANNLHEQGHTIMIINFSMQYPTFLFPGKTQYTSVVKVPYDNLRIINSISPFTWYKAARKIVNFNPDYIVFRYWMPFMAPSLGTIAYFLHKKGFKNIAITDNIIPHERHLIDNILTKYFLRNIHKVICMSEKVKNELLSIGYNGTIVNHPHPIYNSYGPMTERNEACQKLALNPKESYTLFFGFIRYYKGLDILLKAWSKLKIKEGKKLLIAGEFYDDKDKYMDLINSLGISNDVILRTEYIPEEDVNLYFSVADLVVQPYRSASQSGISGIAYNYLIPMIVTNVGGLTEIIEDGKEGFVTKVDETSIADAIERYYKNNLKYVFSENMKKRLADFSWNGMIRSLFI